MAEKQNGSMTTPKFDNNTDLYAQISASDQAEDPKKQKNSLIMSIMIGYMRLTLRLDEKRRQYQRFFHILSNIWMGVMACLYLCGLVMFGILIGSYFRFPTYVEEYLAEQGILYDKKEIPGYVFSQVDLYGLHDKNNTYQIEKVSLVSTFADFLNRRAKNLSLSGVKLNIETELKKGEDILSKIAHLNNKASVGTGVRVDSLDISDAKIVIKGKNYTLPVSLSLTGVYGQETNISAFVKVKEPYLDAEGPLQITRKNGKTKWNFTVHNGRVALPNHPSEALDGSVILETANGHVISAKTDLSLTYDKLQKAVGVNLTQVGPDYEGELSLRWVDKTNAQKPVDRTAVTLGLSKLKVDSTGKVYTESPVKVNLTSKYLTELKVDELKTELTGKLTCQLFENCSYDLTQNGSVKIKGLQLPVQGTYIKSEGSVNFTLKPRDKMIAVSFKSGDADFNADLEKFSLKGKGVDSAEKVSLFVGAANLQSKSNLWEKLVDVNLNGSNIIYKTPTQEIYQGRLSIQNMFDPNEVVTLLSPRVLLTDNSYLKEPFSVTYTKSKNKTRADVQLENNQARLMFDGYLDMNGFVVDGLLVIPTVHLGALKQPLNRISSLVPEGLIKVSGDMMGYGHLSGNLRSGILGPFYLALKNVGIKTEHLTVNRVNTVLTLTSFAPLLSEANQKVFIGQVDSFFPITDVTFDIQLGDKFAQISNLNAMMLGIPLISEAVLLPYRNIPTIIYFKNKDSDLSQILKGISFQDWVVAGNSKGNILFPLEVKDFIVKLKSASIQLMDMHTKYVGKNKPAFMEEAKGMLIRSGNIVIDEGEGNNIQANLVLDILLEPSNIKKVIRETYQGTMGQVVTIKEQAASKVPQEIMKKISEIQRKTNTFMAK